MADPQEVRDRLVRLGASPDDEGLAAIVAKLIDGGAIAADFTLRTAAQFRQIPIGVIGTNLSSADINTLLDTYAGAQGGSGRPATDPDPVPAPTAPAPTQTSEEAAEELRRAGAARTTTPAAPTRSPEEIAEEIASLEFEHGRFNPDTNTFADGTQIEITEGGDILPVFAPAGGGGFAPPSPGAGNTILQPGETLVGPNGETLRALPPDPQFGQTFQNERTGEVFRVEGGQLVPVPELAGFAGIAPQVSFDEQVRQFGITQQGLNQRNALSNAPGFLNAATAINQQQQSILNSGGDVVLRRFLAAGEPTPAGLQTFNQADQLRGFNLPGLLNQFGGLTQSLGFGPPGAGFGAPAPAPTAAPAPATGIGGTSGVGDQGTGFPPEVQAVIDAAARDAAAANAPPAAPADTSLIQNLDELPDFVKRNLGVPALAHGGVSNDVALVGEEAPELVAALPGGGFAVIPFEGKPPKGVKKAQGGGTFGLPTPPDVTQTELQGFARETAFPNVRRVFQQGLAPQGDQFSFALPTFRGLQGLSPDDRANAETALRLGAFGGQPTTFADVERAVRNRFLPSQGRGRSTLAGF